MKKYLISIIVVACTLFITSCEEGGIIPNPSNELEEFINAYANSGLSNIELLENDLQTGVFKSKGYWNPKWPKGDEPIGGGTVSAFFCDFSKIKIWGYSGSHGNYRYETILFGEIKDDRLATFWKDGIHYRSAKILYYDGKYLLLLEDDENPLFREKGTYQRFEFILGNEQRDYYNNVFINEKIDKDWDNVISDCTK